MPETSPDKLVLIIDDDEVDRMACRRTLSRNRSRFRIIEAELGGDGLRAIQKEQPDIVLLDYRLPDLDGIAVLREIAESGEDAPAVVMMTGDRDVEVAVEAMRLGARNYLIKDSGRTYLGLLPEVLDHIVEECVLREQKRGAEEALREANQQLEQRVRERTAELFAQREQAMITLASIADAVFVADNEGCVRQMNPAAEQMTRRAGSDLASRILCDQVTFLRASDRSGIKELADLFPEKKDPMPLILLRPDGEELVVTASGGKMHDNEGNAVGVVVVLHDITREHARSRALMYQATHDALTHLPNRLLFEDRLSQSLNRAGHNHEKLAVMFLDLDGFKNVNDTFGHRAGDALLQFVAGRLQGCIRESDSLARLAGDEFTIVVAGKSAEKVVQIVANKVLRELTTPFDIEGNNILIGTSMGISIFPDDGDSPEELMGKADSAMYQAKMQGGSTYQYYSAGKPI